jgi:hypothetical protein
MGVMWDDATVISVWALGDMAKLLEKEETWCESCEYSLDDTNPELVQPVFKPATKGRLQLLLQTDAITNQVPVDGSHHESVTWPARIHDVLNRLVFLVIFLFFFTLKLSVGTRSACLPSTRNPPLSKKLDEKSEGSSREERWQESTRRRSPFFQNPRDITRFGKRKNT